MQQAHSLVQWPYTPSVRRWSRSGFRQQSRERAQQPPTLAQAFPTGEDPISTVPKPVLDHHLPRKRATGPCLVLLAQHQEMILVPDAELLGFVIQQLDRLVQPFGDAAGRSRSVVVVGRVARGLRVCLVARGLDPLQSQARQPLRALQDRDAAVAFLRVDRAPPFLPLLARALGG